MSKTNLSHRVKQTLLLLCLMCSAFGLKAAVVTPEANKTYFIVNKQTGCVLSNGNSTNTDSPIYCLTREENNYGQRWTMELYSSCHAVHPLSISDISSRASMSEPATAGAGRNGKPAWGAGARRPS